MGLFYLSESTAKALAAFNILDLTIERRVQIFKTDLSQESLKEGEATYIAAWATYIAILERFMLLNKSYSAVYHFHSRKIFMKRHNFNLRSIK